MTTKKKDKPDTGFVLLVGNKPIKGYITAVLVTLKSNIDTVIVKARGRSISKAVDVAEILKRFENPTFKVTKIETATAEMNIEGSDKPRRVSSIEITLAIKV